MSKTPIEAKKHLTVDDCLKLYEEEGIIGLVEKVKTISFKAGIEKGRQAVIKEIEGMDKRHTVGFVLDALKEGKDV